MLGERQSGLLGDQVIAIAPAGRRREHVGQAAFAVHEQRCRRAEHLLHRHLERPTGAGELADGGHGERLLIDGFGHRGSCRSFLPDASPTRPGLPVPSPHTGAPIPRTCSILIATGVPWKRDRRDRYGSAEPVLACPRRVDSPGSGRTCRWGAASSVHAGPFTKRENCPESPMSSPRTKSKNTPQPLSDTEIAQIATEIAAGRPPMVWFTAAAVGIPEGRSGKVIALGEPSDGDFLQIRPTGSKDVLSFSPAEVTMTKPARDKAVAQPASTTRKESPTVTKPSAPTSTPATPPAQAPAAKPAPEPATSNGAAKPAPARQQLLRHRRSRSRPPRLPRASRRRPRSPSPSAAPPTASGASTWSTARSAPCERFR